MWLSVRASWGDADDRRHAADGAPNGGERRACSSALLSWVFAIMLALPLSAVVNGMVGRPLFNVPLPLVSRR